MISLLSKIYLNLDKDIGSLKGNKQLDCAVGSTPATDYVNISIPPSNERVSYLTSTQDHAYTNHVSDDEGGNDDCVYSNPKDITKYRIPVTELQWLVSNRQHNQIVCFLLEIQYLCLNLYIFGLITYYISNIHGVINVIRNTHMHFQ
jgi:hypothetical protein